MTFFDILPWMLVALLLGSLVIVAASFREREKKLLKRLEKMLEESMEGRFVDQHFDESEIAAVETSMRRYLGGHQTSYAKVCREKEQIHQLISNISHQTVTPIANLVLYAQLLEEWVLSQQKEGSEMEGTSEILEEIEAIKEQTQKLDFLVEALMKLSRLETGILQLHPEAQKLQPLLRTVQSQFAVKAEEKELEISFEKTEAEAVFDLKWSIEALANLVDNAVKYTPKGGKVSVSIEAYTFFVCVSVSDTGEGIPEEEQAEIFTRFYRSQSVSSQSGLGLGLYLAREVMKAQKGYIKVISKEGKGSTFSLFFQRENRKI